MFKVTLSREAEIKLSTMDEVTREVALKWVDDLKHWDIESRRWRSLTRRLVLGRANAKKVYQLTAEADLVLFFEVEGKKITVGNFFHQDTLEMVRESINS